MGRLTEADAQRRRDRAMASGVDAGDFSEALARGIAVLTAFDADHSALSQADVARMLDLSRATARRALVTLEHLGYLRSDGRMYSPTPKVLELATSFVTANPVSTVLQPTCDRLAAELGASCSVAVIDGDDALMIARAVPPDRLPIGTGVGFRVPADRSALGLVLRALTDDASTSQALDRVREDGYCYVADDVELGFHSIAVPVARWDGVVVAAMNVGATVNHISRDEMLARILPLLREACGEVRTRLL